MALLPFGLVDPHLAEPGCRLIRECPECGATGCYDLLVQRVCAIQEAWAAAVAAIGMESAS